MVIIRVNGETAEIRVEDDGCGFDPALAAKQNGHFGLKIMRERAAEISAQFDVQSNLGEGTKIVLRIPLEERKSEAVSPMNG
jgi:signal transduction histidine kinase